MFGSEESFVCHNNRQARSEREFRPVKEGGSGRGGVFIWPRDVISQFKGILTLGYVTYSNVHHDCSHIPVVCF